MDGTDDKIIHDNAILYTSPQKNKIVYIQIDTVSNNGIIMSSDINGNNKMTITDKNSKGFPILSPDGTKILWFNFIRKMEGNAVELFIMNSDGTNQKSLYYWLWRTDDYLPNPKFSPDLKKIAITVPTIVDENQSDIDSVIILNSDGSGKDFILVYNDLRYGMDWHPDGNKLICASNWTDKQLDIIAIDIKTKEVKKLTDDGAYKVYPTISPDGSKIAYFQGACDVHIINIDGTGHINLTNNSGKPDEMRRLFPTWSPDGKLIVYPYTLNEAGREIYTGDELRTVNIYTREVNTIIKDRKVLNGYAILPLK